MNSVNPQSLKRVLVTDCGSTTTKALLFEKTEDGWRQTSRGEAPTTVEEPVADVTVGALNAFTEIQEVRGCIFLSEGASDSPFLLQEQDASRGIDLYLSTSSAGGGLQMLVAGVVREMTTESAERAALGAGAIVLDALSADDGREDHERIERIRHLRPDIILLTGGVDGGSQVHVIENAELLLAASPRPRFGDTLTLPIIYAGNKDAAEEVGQILSDVAQISVVENVRPTLEHENLGPAREAIHEFFLSHVMSHSPGYDRLMSWSPVPIMPTPAAVGDMVQIFAERNKTTVLCADIGGATTDVFSVFSDDSGNPVFNRTVSANLGMSYSVANVLIEAGTEAIARWLPYELPEYQIRDRLRNKMIRPTSIPQTLEDLFLEQAICREALRLSLEHHRSLAVGLSGVQQQRSIADIFAQTASRSELVDRMKLDVVIGSGGVLSHAPSRLSAALMMLDGFSLEGFTRVFVDSIFMMPHLGVFSRVHPEAAHEIFVRDCLIHVADTVAAVYDPKKGCGKEVATVRLNDKSVQGIIDDTVVVLPLEQGAEYTLEIVPLAGWVNVGAGPGETLLRQGTAGQCGLILDGRNRPIREKHTLSEQAKYQQTLFETFGLLQKGGI